MLNGELYAQRLQKLIYLHLSTDLFHEDVSSLVGTKSKFCTPHKCSFYYAGTAGIELKNEGDLTYFYEEQQVRHLKTALFSFRT